jgi:threonine dehydrogenase-like Zn-dependent dehydrogenase
MARQFGAAHVIQSTGPEALEEIARITGGGLIPGEHGGKPAVHGGVDVAYECAGSAQAVDFAFRTTAPRGAVVLLGLLSVPRGVDWAPVWLRELDVVGSYCYGTHEHEGKELSTHELAVSLLAEGTLDLAPLLTHRYGLSEYRAALDAVTDKRRSNVLRAAFEFPAA